MNQYGGMNAMDYSVDLVFCIDATGSMEDSSGTSAKIINIVKENALNFYGDFRGALLNKGKEVSQLRIRIVAFRDYRADGDQAMLVTDFFLLPQQEQEFEACIRSINADGGGDVPEDGLEALAYAIKSDWNNETAKKRHVIVVWTDAPTHDLGYGNKSRYYPSGMPQDLSELSDWWDEMNENAKRLVLFAPRARHWDYISDNWENVIHYPSVAGNGLAEKSYLEILGALVNSV